jgi:hypothetical protein
MDHCFLEALISRFVVMLNPFSFALRSKRPGLSHHGVGLELRNASSDACAQFSRLLANSGWAKGDAVCREGPIVEAFPNAFLGVLMPEVEMLLAHKLLLGATALSVGQSYKAFYVVETA